jgi:predicted XRE-type DNA-binding protein
MVRSSQVTKGRRKRAVTPGTGNVFADLGFPDAVERQAKLRLAYALNQTLARHRFSPAAASRLLRVTQSKLSGLRHYKLGAFSVERLMNLLAALDQDFERMRRKPRWRRRGAATS